MKTASIAMIGSIFIAFSIASPVVFASSAFTASGFSCGAIDHSGNENATTISTFSWNGHHGTMSCIFGNGSFPNSGPAFKDTASTPGATYGQVCSGYAHTTSNWWLVVNSTGGASLQCKF